jgi:hypothetical protein
MIKNNLKRAIYTQGHDDSGEIILEIDAMIEDAIYLWNEDGNR